ncbi:MAG: thiaminase II [Eubacterium sp.]|nr:thiaminase II [Eubacterium sp.]
MKVTERLLAATKEIWDAYNEHPFVLGLQNGTLDREKFRFYIIQDSVYLIDFAKVFAIGVAKAKSLETANLFASYIPVMNGELNVHEGYLARLGVTEEEMKAARPSLDNLSYTSYMLRVAYEEGEAEVLVSILSCALSYELIGKRIVENRPEALEDPFYGDWVKGYYSEEYAAANRELTETLEKLTKDYSEEQIAHLIDIFIACSRYEMDFWEMSWNMKM